MYSSHDVKSDILHPPSPPETIPPDVPPHVDQSYRHHSASCPANVSSNSATIHQIHNNSTTSLPHRRAKPRKLLGLWSFAKIAGKIPFRRTPRLASENHVTAFAQPSRREHHPADSSSSPIPGTTSYDRGGQVSPLFDLMPSLVVLTSSLGCRLPLVQTAPKTLLSAPYSCLSCMIYSLQALEESNNRP